MMKALVTGASGFIGSNLVRRLHADGHEVIAHIRPNEQSLDDLNIQTVGGELETFSWDGIGGIDALFHQAAITDTLVHDNARMFRVNCQAALTLFEEAARRGCKNIVYASSTAVYGNSLAPFIEHRGEFPLNEYGKSKLALDRAARRFAEEHPGVFVVGLRYCNVFGQGENHKGPMASMIYRVAQQLVGRKAPIIFKWGEHKRDCIYVRDVVAANLLALNAKQSCVVNCGGGIEVSFNELVDCVQEALGTDRRVNYVDMPPEVAETYQRHTRCDMDAAERLIGFRPNWGFREGVRNYAACRALRSAPIK